MTLDWSASTGLIASGGRDKSVKVILSYDKIWDPKSSGRKPTQVIHTIAPVSRVKWRPGFPDQIASASLSLDSRIQIWNISRPYIPRHILADFEGSDTTGLCLSNS